MVCDIMTTLKTPLMGVGLQGSVISILETAQALLSQGIV